MAESLARSLLDGHWWHSEKSTGATTARLLRPWQSADAAAPARRHAVGAAHGRDRMAGCWASLRSTQPTAALQEQEKARQMPGFLRSGFAGYQGGAQGSGEAFDGQAWILRIEPTPRRTIGNLTGNDSDLLHFSSSFRYTMPNGLRPAGKGCEASYPFFLCMTNQIYSVA